MQAVRRALSRALLREGKRMLTSTAMMAMTASSSMRVKPGRALGRASGRVWWMSDRDGRAFALDLVDDPSGQGRLLGPDAVGLLCELPGEGWVGVEGVLDAARDRASGPAELRATSERCRKPGAEDKWQAIGLGQEWRHGADRAGDGSAGGVSLVVGRSGQGVVGGGELVGDDAELGPPARGKIGRGLRIIQGLAQGTLSSGQGIA